MAKPRHGVCVEVYWHGNWTSHLLIAVSWHKQPWPLGCRCAKAHRDLPKGQTLGWFKRRSSYPLPWEFCPAEHFKADTFPAASFKSIPVSHHHTVLVSLAQLHRKSFLVTSFISPPPPPPSSSASDEFSGSSALDQPSFSSDASREWDGLAQPWGRNSWQLTLQQGATDWEKCSPHWKAPKWSTQTGEKLTQGGYYSHWVKFTAGKSWPASIWVSGSEFSPLDLYKGKWMERMQISNWKANI